MRLLSKLLTIGILLIGVSACDPAMNPVMGLGKSVSTTQTPVHEQEVFFKEDLNTIFSAIEQVGNNGDKNIVLADKEANKIVIKYPFSMLKNVWGGNFNVYLDEVDGKTRMVVHFFEFNHFINVSILNPFIEDIKTKL